VRAAAATPVLGAKLLPPSPGPFHLRRARLHDALKAGPDRRATAVVAGPGYGKSALVARFLQESGGDTVWYSLDSSDRDAAVFFRYLMQGLREHAPEFGERIDWLWKDARPRSRRPEELADVFMGEAEESLGGRVLVVLDRVDALEGSAAARGLKRLLAWLPGTLHLVLIGRSLPEIGLKGLEAEGLAATIGGDRLLFTADETRALLLETFKLPLDAATVRRAHERTRGWVTALRLLRETAGPGGATPDLPERIFAKTESEIFDYFTEKVLDAETPEMRSLLIESSPPEVFDPDLLAEVLEGVDARALLPSLLRRNLFVSHLESRAAHVAYDPLFRDYLRRRLAADRSLEARRGLEGRYARAFARRGEFEPALRHALAAGDAKGIADLLARQGKALLRGGFLEAVREGCQFLARLGAPSPRVDDLLGESSRLAGDFTAAIAHFERALAPSSAGEEALDGTARASTLQGLAFSLLETGALTRAAATAEVALGAAGAGDPALVARILNTLALVHYRSEKHDEAAARWQEALARARQAGDEHLTSMIAHNLGLPHAVRGDFRRAAECFRLLTARESTRVGPEEGAAYLNLARIALLRGEHAEAAALLSDAREIAHKLRLRALAADVLEAEGTLLRESGDLKGAAERYARARDEFTGLGRLDLLPGLAEEEGIRLALDGRADEAERTIAPLVEQARAEPARPEQAGAERRDPERLGSALLAAGEIAARAGENERAVARLGEAAEIFSRLDRSYPSCLAHGWLALAALRRGDRTHAREATATALALSARHDYAAALRRIASADAGFARWLQETTGAPPALVEKAAPVAAGTPKTDAADLTVRLFGPVEVYRDREHAIPPRAWKIRRALTIFCYLAASRDRRAGKERIIEALWGDARLSVIEKNFHPTISFLRRALNDGHAVPRHFILFERGAYRLNPAYRYDIDTERFEGGLRAGRDRARAGDAAGALAAWDAALPLYRGPFLEEDYDEWAEGPRTHYERLYSDALKEAGRLHVERGDPEAGLGWLRRAVELDPLDEAASAALMTAFGALARRADVEKEFDRLRKTLDAEVSSVPSAATRQAFERARQAGSASGSVHPAPAGKPGGRR
jgi:LuxR family maltose regulon positive regulatory protein